MTTASSLFLHNLDAYYQIVGALTWQREIMEREILCACWKFLGVGVGGTAYLHGLDQT
jgi:hypothetical protein